MTTITHFLSDDHRRCDTLFIEAEHAATAGDWASALEVANQFCNMLLHHFHIEEEILFPAFEQAIGNTAGPTSVMRGEHQQMKQLLDLLVIAIEQEDASAYAGYAETLNIMMQQHNMKEEGILYKMADRVLADGVRAVLDTMRDCAPQFSHSGE